MKLLRFPFQTQQALEWPIMRVLATLFVLLAVALPGVAADEFQTSEGTLTITPIAHATFAIQAGGQTILVDPVGQGDYSGFPKADIILITHTHGDHFDPAKISELSKDGTVVLAPPDAVAKMPSAREIRNDSATKVGPWRFDAIPAYNMKRGPSAGTLFHEKGHGNGYIVTYGGLRIYIAGDTEATPEMRALRNIDVAFIPMNLPYTMTPEEAAEAVKAFHPKVVYPYHYRGSDLNVFKNALAGTGIDVRLREWYP